VPSTIHQPTASATVGPLPQPFGLRVFKILNEIMSLEQALFEKKLKFESWELVPLLAELPRDARIIEYRCTSRYMNTQLFGVVITDMRCAINIHKMSVGRSSAGMEKDLEILHDNHPFKGGIELFARPLQFWCPDTLRMVIELEHRPSVLPSITALVYRQP
jgi:hypothetical protein